MEYPVINILPSPDGRNPAVSNPINIPGLPRTSLRLSKSAHVGQELLSEEREGLVSQSSVPESIINYTPKAGSNQEITFCLRDTAFPSVNLSCSSPNSMAVGSDGTKDFAKNQSDPKENSGSLTELFGNNRPRIEHIGLKRLKRSRSANLVRKTEELKSTNVENEQAQQSGKKTDDKKDKLDEKVKPKTISFWKRIFTKKPETSATQEESQAALKYLASSGYALPGQSGGYGYAHAPSLTNYPPYKIDKRLIFMGQDPKYAWHVISYHSTFRRVWNLIILGLIMYEIFWYPLAVSFILNQPWPVGLIIFELLSIGIFFLDIFINMRTTYSNENNEEIVDGTMMRKKYTQSKRFIIDVITVLPIQEIMLFIAFNSDQRWTIYSVSVLVRMLRLFKISAYIRNRLYSTLVKLFRIFVAFFILVHWASCIWCVIIKEEYIVLPPLKDLWYPNSLRMMGLGDEYLESYYTTMEVPKAYGITLLSVFMLAIGSDMAPITNVQIWLSVLIGLFGAAILAYRAGVVILTINKANNESDLYGNQLEELTEKLKVNKVPHNLRVKVMEYFYYSWRKHNVLRGLDDFSELSRPLQRDIALYRHQEMIMKVPLFRELDPAEILSIIQKLKTSIYMPGDKIVREGERGTEMFIVQEGVAEMVVKKFVGKGASQVASKPKSQQIFLEKGSYFGEVALMSNSKRTFDVTAFEFCILLSFSKADYKRLNTEFKDIGPRLRSGLKHYKNTHMASLIQILKNLNIFQNFTQEELAKVADEYLEEIFVDSDKVILGPKNRTNALYIMLEGMINCYEDNDETRNYLSNLKRSDTRDNWTIVGDEDEVDCLDDDVLKLEKDKISMEDQKTKLDLLHTYTYGDYFGTLDFDINEIKCDKFYVSDSGCQLGVITQSLKSQMAAEDPLLYAKLRENILKCTPRRSIAPIEEESDSSFATKNNTILKTKITRPGSKTEFGKKPVLIKISTMGQNKEEDLASMKEELQQLEDEVLQFTSLLAGLNNRLNKTPTQLNLERNSVENFMERQNTNPKVRAQSVKISDKTESDELLQILANLDKDEQIGGKFSP